MLRRLSVENYALIEKLEMELDPHLNIITGETGAGKSILLGALGLLLGAKNDGSAMKDAARSCTVEGTFALAGPELEEFFAENDLEYAAETTLTRIITPAGKSRAFVNDVPVSLAQLREVGTRLLDIHSQHQNLILSSEEFRTSALDTVAANGELLTQYAAQYARLTELRRRLAALREEAANGRRDEEWLRFQTEELTSANLRPGEQAELEEELARFLHKEAVITFGTGFQSNVGIISALVGRHDYVICDRENHASIYAGCQMSYGKMLRYRHSDMEDLEKQLARVPEQNGTLIVTDGVFSMGGDIANLPEICALAKKYGARVMVDDAHGLGVIGEGGRGTASYYGLEDHVDIYMGTFSKSLASLGGYMASSSRVADFVRHSSRPFIFSASIPPANAAAALAALRELEAHPELVTKLQENALYMRGLLNERNIKMRPSNGDRIPIIPIYTYEPIPTLTIAKELYERGVYVNSSLPPAAAPHECLLRTSLMATHTHALIDEAVGVIADVLRGYDL